MDRQQQREKKKNTDEGKERDIEKGPSDVWTSEDCARLSLYHP